MTCTSAHTQVSSSLYARKHLTARGEGGDGKSGSAAKISSYTRRRMEKYLRSGHVMMHREEPSCSYYSRLACACRAYPPPRTVTHTNALIHTNNSHTLPVPLCSTTVTYSALRNPLSNLGSSAHPNPPTLLCSHLLAWETRCGLRGTFLAFIGCHWGLIKEFLSTDVRVGSDVCECVCPCWFIWLKDVSSAGGPGSPVLLECGTTLLSVPVHLCVPRT